MWQCSETGAIRPTTRGGSTLTEHSPIPATISAAKPYYRGFVEATVDWLAWPFRVIRIARAGSRAHKNRHQNPNMAPNETPDELWARLCGRAERSAKTIFEANPKMRTSVKIDAIGFLEAFLADPRGPAVLPDLDPMCLAKLREKLDAE